MALRPTASNRNEYQKYFLWVKGGMSSSVQGMLYFTFNFTSTFTIYN